jgi:hypothetical protein
MCPRTTIGRRYSGSRPWRQFGGIYATYSFIHGRPDQGMMVANNLPHAPMVHVALSGGDEVAEPGLPSSFSAPLNHSMR